MESSNNDPQATAPAHPAEPDRRDNPTQEVLDNQTGEGKRSTRIAESSTGGVPSTQLNLQQLLDRALNFLSTASNETLGACLVGLGATTYFILGRLGLVLIGAVGGIALHAAWEGRPSDEASRASEERRRKEVGLDILYRILKVRDSGKEAVRTEGEEELPVRVEVFAGRRLDFTGFSPDTRLALEELTDAVIRDYVKWWYSPILPTEASFPAACRQTLTAFLLGIAHHISRKRPADAFLDFLTHSSATVTIFLSELATATSAAPTASVQDAIRIYLDAKPNSSLATIVDRKNQDAKLNMVSEDILECYLDYKAYNCEPVRIFLQQILAKVCIDMTITSCAKPEFINGWIVYLLEEGEPEIMKKIDAGVESAVEDGPRAVKEQTAAAEAATDDVEMQRKAQHKRNVSRAQEAMEEAMKEAQRLSQMIAEHDANTQRTGQATTQPVSSEAEVKDRAESIVADSLAEPTLAASVASIKTDATESTTQGAWTPTSSQAQSEKDLHDETNGSHRDSSEPQLDEAEQEELPPLPARSFTSFDQLASAQLPAALAGGLDATRKEPTPPLTLHNAHISIFDDSDSNDRKALRQKPQNDYMIQIEPAASGHSGWMVFRKYADFENLHFVLSRIARIAGAAAFADAHAQLPSWKGTTESKLREALERYLLDAVRFQSLAESEGMKRFLEKDQAISKAPGAKAGFGWPSPAAFETMGKGMLDTLAKAPKDVAGGGKAIIGGVTGVFTGGRQKKPSISNSSGSPSANARRTSTVSNSTPSRPSSTFERSQSNLSLSTASRASQDIVQTQAPIIDTQPAPEPQMNSAPPSRPETPPEAKSAPRQLSGTAVALGGDQFIQLPPLPSEIADDYDARTSTNTLKPKPKDATGQTSPLRQSISAASAENSLTDTAQNDQRNLPEPIEHVTQGPAKPKPPLAEEETTIAVELLFAMINELYTLSSAWSLRRTLLNAAKTFLLRPGNPQLASITQLLQSTVLDANTSDAAIALHLRKLRLNALPTEQELRLWPPEPTVQQKEELRLKARRLLIERGMPAALTGVMGQAASAEALAKVFDCLQVERVARGFVFGIMLQGLRAVTQ